ncbi:exported hypothetical protein [Pseudomonas chlororaphis]
MPNTLAGLSRLTLWITLLLASVAALGATEPEPAPLSLATLMSMRQTLPPAPPTSNPSLAATMSSTRSPTITWNTSASFSNCRSSACPTLRWTPPSPP